jgi:hypothetical protein
MALRTIIMAVWHVPSDMKISQISRVRSMKGIILAGGTPTLSRHDGCLQAIASPARQTNDLLSIGDVDVWRRP